MKPEAQIKAIAELDGWNFVPSQDVRGVAQPEYWFHDNDEVAFCYKDSPANYLHSYDAIIPVIQKFIMTDDGMTSCGMACMLIKERTGKITIAQFTTQELCEALLRATGKWIE